MGGSLAAMHYGLGPDETVRQPCGHADSDRSCGSQLSYQYLVESHYTTNLSLLNILQQRTFWTDTCFDRSYYDVQRTKRLGLDSKSLDTNTR